MCLPASTDCQTGEHFIHPSGERVEYLFKLYPWEWMVLEPFAEHLYRLPCPIRMVEPPWKMVLRCGSCVCVCGVCDSVRYVLCVSVQCAVS